MGIHMEWKESHRTLTLSLAEGSRMLPPVPRQIEVKLIPSGSQRSVTFAGKPLEVKLD